MRREGEEGSEFHLLSIFSLSQSLDPGPCVCQERPRRRGCFVVVLKVCVNGCVAHCVQGFSSSIVIFFPFKTKTVMMVVKVGY